MIRRPHYNTLVSFKLQGSHFKRLQEYCTSHDCTPSEILRSFAEVLVEEKAQDDQ
jgi:DNA-binding Xre family transcriptional regulator